MTQIASIIILLWVYAVAVLGFVKIFSKEEVLNANFDLSLISFIISLTGIVLGLFFHKIVMLNRTVKNYIIVTIPAFVLILIISTYLIAGFTGLVDLFVLLLRVMIIFFMSIIPLAAVYGMLSKQKNLMLVSGLGIVFFLFLMIILSKVKTDNLLPFYTEVQLPVLILLFVMFLAFMELGLASIFFKSSLDKMTSSNTTNEHVLRLSRVFNRYLVYISLTIGLCYFLSMFVLWFSGYGLLLNSDGFLGVDFSSVYGVLFLTVVILAGALLFWYLLPREKVDISDDFA